MSGDQARIQAQAGASVSSPRAAGRRRARAVAGRGSCPGLRVEGQVSSLQLIGDTLGEIDPDGISEVENLEATLPSKDSGELGTLSYDSEGNLIGIDQPVREPARRR